MLDGFEVPDLVKKLVSELDPNEIAPKDFMNEISGMTDAHYSLKVAGEILAKASTQWLKEFLVARSNIKIPPPSAQNFFRCQALSLAAPTPILYTLP